MSANLFLRLLNIILLCGMLGMNTFFNIKNNTDDNNTYNYDEVKIEELENLKWDNSICAEDIDEHFIADLEQKLTSMNCIESLSIYQKCYDDYIRDGILSVQISVTDKEQSEVVSDSIYDYFLASGLFEEVAIIERNN